MKLATLKTSDTKKRNGELVLVTRDNLRAARVPVGMPTTLIEALQNWKEVEPKLRQIHEDLDLGKLGGSFPLDPADCLAPLPHAPGFYDGSAFLSHVFRARKSRGDDMPPSAKVIPLMYQGVSDYCLAAHDSIRLMDESFGGDFEGEFAVITTDVPRGTSSENAGQYIALLTMFNDITYRELLKKEIEFKFGFLQSKPNSSYAPFAITPDELGDRWENGRVHLDLNVEFNGKLFGHPNGREMQFSFSQLVAHAARTRPLSAGSIVGSGTVSNENKEVGFACLTEKRFQEILDTGKAETPWLKPNDRVVLDVTLNGNSVFGAIDEKTVLN